MWAPGNLYDWEPSSTIDIGPLLQFKKCIKRTIVMLKLTKNALKCLHFTVALWWLSFQAVFRSVPHITSLSIECNISLSTCSIFAVTVSSQVRGGKQETLCAQIHGPTEPVTLTVTLEVDASSTVILEEAVKQDFYRCLNFQVWLNICTYFLVIFRVMCGVSQHTPLLHIAPHLN